MQQIFFILLALLVLALVVTQVRNQRMAEKYALLWIIVSGAVLLLALFPPLLAFFAQLFGFVAPVNLLFLLAILLLIAVTLHLSLELSQAADNTRKLAEEVAILRATIEQGKAAKINKTNSSADS